MRTAMQYVIDGSPEGEYGRAAIRSRWAMGDDGFGVGMFFFRREVGGAETVSASVDLFTSAPLDEEEIQELVNEIDGWLAGADPEGWRGIAVSYSHGYRPEPRYFPTM